MITIPSLALAMKVVLASSLTDMNIPPIVDNSTPQLQHHSRHHSKSSTANQNYDTSSNAYDFYVYSMTYQPEFCHSNSQRFRGCHHPQELWEGQLTIHGLWPQRDDGSWPSSCTNEQLNTEFYVSGTNSILNELEVKWPNIKADPSSSSHTEFWSHEWTKHGTCSGLMQFDYFSSALQLLIDTPEVVRRGYGTTIHKNDLVNGYGGESMVALVCKSGYLSEVRACFAKMENGMPGERMECPGKVLEEDSCGDEISIASFETMYAAVE